MKIIPEMTDKDWMGKDVVDSITIASINMAGFAALFYDVGRAFSEGILQGIEGVGIIVTCGVGEGQVRYDV